MSDETEASPAKKAKAKRAPMTAAQLGKYIIGAAAVVGALAALGSQMGDWMRWGLGIDTMQQTISDQAEQINDLKRRLRAREAMPNANERLDEAIPRIATAFRSSNKELRTLNHATTRLATIHEFGLDANRAREAAQQVQNRLRRSGDEGEAADEDDSAMDALADL
jgi:hypothetical protein